MYTFLFLVPKNGTYLQVGYCPTAGASVIPIDKDTEKHVNATQIYASARAYTISELKQLARKVYDAMQVDSSLIVYDVIYEAMDMLDEEIKQEQKELDGIDQWAEQRGELSWS